MRQGIFITLEGGDGSGKSSFARYLKEELENLGIEYIITREPGGTRIGEQIREILLTPEHHEMAFRTEALLYAASRAQHVAECIEPALEAGKIVICERFVLSSIAYQGYGRALGSEAVKAINDFAVHGRYPDITLFFAVSPALTLHRKAQDPDRLEEAGTEFHRKVYEGYLEAVLHYPGKVYTIDASRTEKEVFEDGWLVLQNYLSGRG